MFTKTTQRVYASDLEEMKYLKYIARGATSIMWDPKDEVVLEGSDCPDDGLIFKSIRKEALRNVLEIRKKDMWVFKVGRLTVLRESKK